MSALRDNIVTAMGLISLVVGSVYTFNEFVLSNKQYELERKIVSHIDQSIGDLRKDLSTLPTRSDVENSQLKSMLYAKDMIDAKTSIDSERLRRIEVQMEELHKKLSDQELANERSESEEENSSGQDQKTNKP